MYTLLKSAKPLFVRKSVPSPRPDNNVFRLHYRLTCGLLAVSAVLVSSYSYIDSSGSAIQCMSGKVTEDGDKSALIINRLEKHWK